LRHDHVVTLFAAGKNAPFTWLAREFVDGESVSRVLRRQERDEEHDVELAARVALHVTRALVFGRENRLRHGAISPSSILIRKNDQVVKLSGFMQQAALEGSVLAEAVKELRSPAEAAYLSPEQATPGAFVDETSDMYALGAVVYAMLTGRPPFTGKTTDEVLEQIRGGGRPERPTKLNRDVPAGFETVVIKLLEKQPEYRYSTPSQLLSDLEPVAAELGVED
jgi:serine/threonine-protein kinase